MIKHLVAVYDSCIHLRPLSSANNCLGFRKVASQMYRADASFWLLLLTNRHGAFLEINCISWKSCILCQQNNKIKIR